MKSSRKDNFFNKKYEDDKRDKFLKLVSGDISKQVIEDIKHKRYNKELIKNKIRYALETLIKMDNNDKQ